MTTEKTTEELNRFHEEYGFLINPKLTDEKRMTLLQLLHDYKDIFARSLEEIKQCKGEPMQIDINTNRKVFKRQFRLNDADKAEATRQILQMERSGVIEKSDTPYWNAPAFLVAKKDGSRRLVVDLRGLNEIITPRLIQLPRIDEMLETITERKPFWLSITDIRAAFWQLSLHENSRDYTTFTAPDGLRYRYCRVPMGLNTAPSQLLLMLSQIFQDKNRYHSIFLYMDDAVIASPTWDGHLQQLEELFKTLADNNLSVNPRKTELAFHEVEYLGFKISADGLRMSKKGTEAILKIGAPKNVKALQRTLGLINFYRRFIPNYAKHTTNIRALLRKDVPFLWTEDCEKELNNLKNCLVSEPVLKPIDPTKPLVLACDGSKSGFGWVGG